MSDPTTRVNAALSGRYRIERELGEGGMATVYLADDLKHDRKVALKVLRPELAAMVGAERFLAEIKTTASLQHPHILPLFDSGEADSFLFYVMPYVEGETLGDRLKREQQLPVDDAVRIATDVADALHAAHEQGVIHRDIKPPNILLSRGRPLVADFGIALAVSAAGGGRLTETGLSIGTPYYMSPEQASADRAPTPASDIYSLGCVLYEMLVGQPPHTGSSAQAVLAKILLGAPPDPTGQRASIPAHVDAAIRRALEKLPADRFRSSQDFARALADPGFRHGDSVRAEVAAGGGTWRRLSIGLGVTTVVLAAAMATTVFRPPPTGQVARFTMPYEVAKPPALLPDGSAMVFAMTDQDGGTQLWLRSWDDLTLRPVSGTDGLGSHTTVTSPDGEEVAFVVEPDRQLRVASLVGGSGRGLTDSALCCPRWERDGFVYFTHADRGIHRVPGAGGSVEPVTQVAPGDDRHSDFNLLEGGQVGVFAVWGEAPRIDAIRLRTGERSVLTPGSRPYAIPSGHLVFASEDGEVLAARLDPEGMELTSAPVVLVEGVRIDGNEYPTYSVSASGTLVYRPAEALRMVRLVWMTRSGEASPVDPAWAANLGGSDNFGWRLSPDGTRLALALETDGNDDIWVKTLPDGPLSRLTFYEGNDQLARWTPDGETLTFTTDRTGGLDLWSVRADGAGAAEPFLDLERGLALGVWSPDGEWLVLRMAGRSGFIGARDVMAIRPGVDSVLTPVAVSEEYQEQAPALSPDGRWVAYTSNETGRHEVFVRPFPDVGDGKWQVSMDGGYKPLWAHSGRELFFLDPQTRELIVAELETTPGFRVMRRESLFTLLPEHRFEPNADFYDISADDQLFLMGLPHETGLDGPPHLILVQNWFEELKGLVGN